MTKPQVKGWIDSLGRFHFDVPVNSKGKEMKGFQKELIRMLEKIESPVEASKVRKKAGIYFFEIASNLSQKKMESLVNQAFSKILKKERR